MDDPSTFFKKSSTDCAGDICTQLGLNPGGPEAWQERIARFVRCNGPDDILFAAKETAQRMGKAHGQDAPSEVFHPWSYAVQVTNGRWVRVRELYLRMGLYEQSLRGRVSGIVGHHLGDRWWETEPSTYLPADTWRWLRRNEPVRAAEPAGPEIPPMKTFASGDQFVRSITLNHLQGIVLHLWEPLFNKVFVYSPGKPFALSYMEASFKRLNRARQDLMHARPVDKGPYPDLITRLDTLLSVLEFDVPKTLGNIAKSPPL